MADEITMEFVEETIEMELCGAVVNTGGALIPVQEIHTLTVTDIANGFKTLSNTPNNPLSFEFKIKGGPPQVYTLDYGISGNLVVWLTYDLQGQLVAGNIVEFKYYI